MCTENVEMGWIIGVYDAYCNILINTVKKIYIRQLTQLKCVIMCLFCDFFILFLLLFQISHCFLLFVCFFSLSLSESRIFRCHTCTLTWEQRCCVPVLCLLEWREDGSLCFQPSSWPSAHTCPTLVDMSIMGTG